MKLLIGSITAVLFSAVVIWSIEQSYSFWQLFTGFVCAILPIVFFSGIRNNVAVFKILSVAIIFGYLSFKWEYNNVWAGILLAFILGFPIHYYKVRHTKVD
ncbi:MAG: hypothetical protein RL528_1277 [Bacteroidota bacterium]|jgi:hypothetical protein